MKCNYKPCKDEADSHCETCFKDYCPEHVTFGEETKCIYCWNKEDPDNEYFDEKKIIY